MKMNSIKLIKIIYRFSFLLVNCILNDLFLAKLNKSPKLNNFETQKTQLNENKLRGFK